VTAVVNELDQVLAGDKPVAIHPEIVKSDPTADRFQFDVAQSGDVRD